MIFRVFESNLSDAYEWELHRGSEKNIAAPVCRSSRSFDTAAEARADVATAKKAMAGTRFAKVVDR